MKKGFIIVFTLILTCADFFAQDIHFSQFFANPLYNNPASTGDFNSDWRVSSAYRSQWGAIAEPYNTISLGLEKQFYWYSQSILGGIYFLNDESGGINLDVNKVYLSAAFQKQLNYHEINIGLQFGWVFKSVDQSKMTLPNQYDNTIGYFNSALLSNESLNSNINYPDLNIGVSWTKPFYKFKPFLGLSFNHILFPKESFVEGGNRLFLRVNLTGGVKYKFTELIYLLPQFRLDVYKNAKSYIIGSNIAYMLKTPLWEINKISAGLYYRDPVNFNFDALIFVFGVDIKQMFLGFSYDVNLSKLKQATNLKGAFEVALIYKGLNTNMKKKTIPCDRY